VNHKTGAYIKQGLAGLILAAGPSTRLGRPKQVVRYRESTLIEHVVNQALEFCGAGLVVVTGAHHEQVVTVLDGLPVETVYNRDWQEGMGSSVCAGAMRIDPACQAIMLMLCDQPTISRADFSSLVNAWTSRPERIAAAEYAGTCGAPAIFPRIFLENLMCLRGDEGAKGIIKSAQCISTVKIPSAEFDVDTPDDLNALNL
jgi:molybdenum cofactor cytidylyltransferase